MTPVDYCRQKVGKPGSSFYYSTLFLPVAKRDAIVILHAYFNEVAEVIDECKEPAVAKVKLEWWREETCNVFAGRPRHLIGKALVSVIDNYGVTVEPLLDFIDGVNMDIDQARYDNFKDLRLYCERVGSTMALLSTRVLQYTEAPTLDYARELGVARTLTGIVRNIGSDIRRNRLYVPTEDLTRFDVPVADIMNRTENDGFRALIEHQIARAETHYERAMQQLPEKDRLAQLPGLILAAIDRIVLNEIRHDGYPVLRERLTLPPLRKLWVAWKTRFREKRRNRRSR